MKKIIALLLVVVCAFALFACQGTPATHTPDDSGSEHTNTDNPGGDTPSTPAEKDVAPFTAAIAATNPQKQVIVITLKPTGMTDTLTGTYTVTYQADNSAVIDYSYEQFNAIGETEAKSTVEGQITRDASGNYSGSISGTASAATAIRLNAEAAKEYATVEGNVLSAQIPAAQTEAVLGVAFDTDVNFVFVISSGIVTSYSLVYTTAKGEVTVSAQYE